MFQSCCTMSSFHAGARWSFSRGQKGSRFAGAMIRAHTFCHQWQSEIYRCKTVKERSHSAGASGGGWNLNLCVIGRQEGRWRSAWGTDTLTAHQRKIPQFAKSSVVTGLELIEHVWKSSHDSLSSRSSIRVAALMPMSFCFLLYFRMYLPDHIDTSRSCIKNH